MRGVIYRLGVSIKECGENTGNVFLICAGLFIRDLAGRVGR